ncbi:MAG: DUF4160 domain-containing protein [Bacteroidetes bacterium]|nr:DUF4160 domain-containing protein [Bacteroidota bacterium]
MPTILRWNGFRFFFYSNEGNEPPHIHVEKAENTAKFWLEEIELADNKGFSKREITVLRILLEEQCEFFKEKWYEFFD